MHPHYILTGQSFGAVHATSDQPPNFWYCPTGTVKLNLQVPYSLAYISQIYLTKIHNMIIYIITKLTMVFMSLAAGVYPP